VWPANAAGQRAAELALARGQLVRAERVGDVVRVVLRVPRQDPDRFRHTPTRPRRWTWIAAGCAAGAVILGALVWLVVLAVAWLTAHVAQVLGVVAGSVAVLYVLGRVGACPGFHCPGCRHR